MRTRWNSLYERENIYFKQQKAQGKDTMEKPQFSRCGTSRTAKDNGVDQKKLLVARSKERYQEICAKMF